GCERTAYTKGEGITLDDIGASDYHLCVSGHIHRPQRLAKNVFYAGSPFCCDWGEVNETKSLLVADISESTSMMNMQRIPSRVPGWHDPSAPGFKQPVRWDNCHVRITVPVTVDPLKELNAARKMYERQYPNAILHLVPDYQNISAAPDSVDLKGGDAAILRRYLEKITLPDIGTSVDQIIGYLEKYLKQGSSIGVQGLHFKSAEGINVLPFEHFKLALDRNGLTLVTGKNLDWGDQISNGSGKSSLVSIPFLALFGKTFKGQSNDEWARQGTDATAKIILVVTLANGQRMEIVRTRRPASVRVYINDKEVTMGDKNTTQAMIEKVTNLTWDVLTNSVYIGQREIGSVFGTDKERKELFSRLLGLDRFIDAWEKLRRVLILRQRAVGSEESLIELASVAINEAGLGIELLIEELNKAPVVDPQKLSSQEGEISNLEYTIVKNDKENQTLDPVLDANQKEFEVFLDKSVRAEAASNLISEQIQAAAKVKVSERCPTCGGKIRVSALESYVSRLNREKIVFNNEAEKYEALQNDNRTVRKALIEKVQANRLANAQAQARIKLLSQEVSVLREQADTRRRLESDLVRKQTRVQELERQKSIHEKAREACVEEKIFTEICVHTMSRDGLPAYLCSVAAPQLNAAAARYSEVFSGGEIGLRFEMSNNDIDVGIANLHGGSNAKDQSSGEMRMAGIIAAFAFRSVLVPHNILVLDEPSEGLDAENAAAFAKGLNQVVEHFKHIILISHNDKILSNLEPDHHIEVVKQNGVSVMKNII